MKLEDRFRELRMGNGLTLKELASLTGLSISYLSDIERGRTSPSLSTLEALAKAFQISVTDVLSGVDFAGKETDASLPAGLAELIRSNQLSQEWIDLLKRIELRGTRPRTEEDWLELYLHLRRILRD